MDALADADFNPMALADALPERATDDGMRGGDSGGPGGGESTAAVRWEKAKPDLSAHFPQYPSTGDGFLVSYEATDAEGIRSSMERYGLVVVRVLSRDQAAATATDALRDATLRAESNGVDPALRRPLSQTDPSTWESESWPAPTSKFLFSTPAFTAAAFEARSCEAVYSAFKILYGGEERLWSSIDNWGVMRGTRFADGTERADWRTSLLPHWDVNPHVAIRDEAAGVLPRFQGLVALVDCPVEVGTFVGVPGSHRYLPIWAEGKTPSTSTQSMKPKRNEPMAEYQQAIPLRAGEMVIWRFELLHANVPNTCATMRLIQFIRYMPAYPRSDREDKYSPPRVWDRYRDERARVEAELAPRWSVLQRRLFGLEDWGSTPYDPDVDGPAAGGATAAASAGE